MLKTVVIGIGNLLMGDDGVGIHAVKELMGRSFNILSCIDAGTSPFDAIAALETAENAVVIDAMKAGGPPGTIYKSSLSECGDEVFAASLHGIDLKSALMLDRPKRLPRITVFGVEPLFIGWSLELSEPVRRSLPLLIDFVIGEVETARLLTFTG